MAELKTKATKASVAAFLKAVPAPDRRRDGQAVAKIMKEATGKKPVMWGPTIVGFGAYRYRYDSGREGDWFLVGFSPRKNDLTLYLMGGLHQQAEHLKLLGKHKAGGSCLYIKRLADIDQKVLRRMIAASVKHTLAAPTTIG